MVVLVLVFLSVGSAFLPGAAQARVVLIGIDGGSWNLIDPRIASGELPNLAALAARGVTGELESVQPNSSPTVWTSVATGRAPAAHRIRNFYGTARDIQVPTTWERLAARGRRVGLYDYLMTWPPRELPDGFVIPSWLRRDERVWPTDAFARAGLSPYAYSLDGVRAPDEILANCLRELAEKPERFVSLLEAFDPEVAAVNFYTVDASSHRFWDDSFPEDFEEGAGKPEERFRDVVPEMLRGVDDAVGRIVAGLAPDDTVLIASDHGFRAQDQVRRVWSSDVDHWVELAGLVPERDGFEVSGGFGFVILRVLPGPFADRDATMERLAELVESARSSSGEALFRVELLDVAPRPAGSGRSWGVWLRQQFVEAFLWWNDVAMDQPAHGWVFGVPQGETLDALWPEGTVRLAGREIPISELTHADDFSGGHHPIGIFLAAGPAIARRAQRIELSVLDLSPLLFYLSGEAIPDDLDGRLPRAAIDEQWLAAHPPRTIDAATLPELPPDSGPAGETADDGQVTERLRSLGYVE